MIKTIGIYLAIVMAFTACSSGTKSAAYPEYERVPASIVEFEVASDEQTLKDIRALNTALAANRTTEIKKDIDRRMAQILTRTSAGYILMKDFDKQLDAAVAQNQGFDLHSNSTYLKLQKTRELIEKVEMRMASVYVHLWKLSLGIDPFLDKMSATRKTNVQKRALQMISHAHAKLSEFSADARLLGVMNLKNHLEEITDNLSTDINMTPSSDRERGNKELYEGLVTTLRGIQAREPEAADLDYNEFIDQMAKVKTADPELKETMEREPQSNVVVEGFKNKTGSDFGKNKWVLTFDDGPHKEQTKKIAGILESNGLKGEFFWLSKLVKTLPSIAKDIYDKGHGINSHSIDHSNLPKLSTSQVTNQVSGSRDVIEKQLHDKGASSYTMKNFRCPYGACWAPKSAKVQQAIKDAGLTHIYWTVDTLDWQDKNTQSVLNRIIKQMKASGRGIILFHDIHPVAGNVLPILFKDKYVTDNSVQWLTL
jgi:peptidoglycan/xylan/chitin deacetylase (PgdA/CDA1 family)